MSDQSDPKKLLLASPLKRFALGSPLTGAVDESPEFHDPYSELNLFLSQKIKQEMRHCSNSKKWSVKLQDELIHKIAPEFEKRFPRYRLGVAALKKTWEKVSYYSTQIQDQKEALTQDGKLNIPFLIKENLRSFSKVKNSCQLHPYHYAHQLAQKMSECIAIVDGAQPKIDQLTQAIWSIHRHLIPQIEPDQLKSPYDEYDKIDKLMVKKILEITAKQPRISQIDLAFSLRTSLRRQSELLALFTSEEIQRLSYALLLEKSGASSQEPLLEKLSFPLAHLIESEIASALIDRPQRALSEAAQSISIAFDQLRQLRFDEENFERKIQTWTQQGDLLCRWIRLSTEGALCKLLMQKWKRGEKPLETTAQEVAKEYVAEYPTLAPYAKWVVERVWTLLKYLWFTQYPDVETSTFDRFLSWHSALICEQSPELTPEELIASLKMLCQNALPLVPFDSDRAFSAIKK